MQLTAVPSEECRSRESQRHVVIRSTASWKVESLSVRIAPLSHTNPRILT